MSTIEVNQSAFVKKMITEFYKFASDVYIEFHSNPEKQKVIVKPPVVKKTPQPNAPAPAPANTIVPENVSAPVDITVENVLINDVPPVQVSETRQQSFTEYFLFKLYFNYGVRRRMINDHIALLFYAKNLRGYKPTEYITMLCRHMMLDLRNLRIISLGIPKAMKLEEFAKVYDINMDDAATNFMVNTVDGVETKVAKHRIYKFPEGTMITYNPSLKKFNVDALSASDNHNDEEEEELEKETKENMEVIQQNLDKQFNQLFQYSTRKVVGTGRFSSTKTFLEMFNENNTIANTNLENIPEEVMQNKVLVFNIEHPENRIISNQVRNFNTLCGVFQFKSEDQANQEYATITGIEYNADNAAAISNGFALLGNNMVTQIHVAVFKRQVQDLGVNLHMPEVIKSFERKNAEGVSESINTDELSFTQLVNIVNSKPKGFQGYIIYGINGERTKIMSTKYNELKILKGNKPIVLEQWNTKNLFYLYWRLMKLQLIPQFIAEFDETGGWSYNQLFYWFANVARGYSINLFKVYHNSFVKKSFDKHNIPYSMKPMCGDLHNMYKSNGTPISQSMVEQYIFEQPAGKIFWRLFSGK